MNENPPNTLEGYPGRSHFTIGQEEVAGYALDWALEHASAAA
jgi:hypothetical protein